MYTIISSPAPLGKRLSAQPSPPLQRCFLLSMRCTGCTRRRRMAAFSSRPRAGDERSSHLPAR
eukprot:9486804-Pyramimonas_sp.AAC.1